MKFRFTISVALSNEEEKNQFESKTIDYIYNCRNSLKYSGYSNGLNYIQFCSYPEEDNWIVYGDKVEIKDFDKEFERFKFYMDYMEFNLKDNEIRLIVYRDEGYSIKIIRNLINNYFNYEFMLFKSLGINYSENKLIEEEVINIDEIAEDSEEYSIEEILDLALLDKELHRIVSPIDISNFPEFIKFRSFGLKEWDKLEYYFRFVLMLVSRAIRRENWKFSKIEDNENIFNEKYTMRRLLRTLGFNGIKFKDLRKTFLKDLSGNLVFKWAV